MIIGKKRGSNEEWFEKILERVKKGGWIVVYGEKKIGIESLRKWEGNIEEIRERM